MRNSFVSTQIVEHSRCIKRETYSSYVRLQKSFSCDQDKDARLIPIFSANSCTALTLKPASQKVFVSLLFSFNDWRRKLSGGEFLLIKQRSCLEVRSV